MKKATKIWLITAGSLIIAGCIIFACVMYALKWDFKKLSTVKCETNVYEINETFNDISITTDTTDIVFALSDDGKCKVECYEKENEKHSVDVENNVLVIKADRHKSWYDYFGFFFDAPKITVYLPKSEYNALSDIGRTGNIKVKATTGDIRVENVSADSLDISVSTGTVTVSNVTCHNDISIDVSTGDTYLSDISCKNIVSDGSTGYISLSNVIADDEFSIERSTGDIKFKDCDASEIYAATSTGNVTGSLLTDKIFITKSSTGDINVPKTTTGGVCEISTHTGDINIKIN